MSDVAREALAKLLRQVENAVCRPGATGGADGLPRRSTRLLFSSASFPKYQGFRTHADKAACNGALQLAERDGAIVIEWDLRSDARTQVTAIEVGDAERLARHLGVEPRWSMLARARQSFEPLLGAHPVLESVLLSWAQEGVPRRTRLSDEGVRDWIDAASVVRWSIERSMLGLVDDISMRRLSIKLFSDSKRLESLSAPVDALLRNDLGAIARDPEEVFGGIGVAKYPSPFLMSAPGLTVDCRGGSVPCPAPYVGLSPASILGFRPDCGQSSPPVVLSVENLTTFHEMSSLVPAGGILVYTGGMPSPSWLRLYRSLLDCLPSSTAVWHWGDIDAGGFRIAHVLATSCAEAGRPLRLHAMDLESSYARKDMSDAEVSQVASVCERWGWARERAFVERTRSAQEQEGQRLTFPTAGAA